MDYKALLILFRKNMTSVISGAIILSCLVYLVMDMGKKEDLDSRFRDLSIQHGRIIKNLKFSGGLDEDLTHLEELVSELESELFNYKDLASNYNYFFQLESKTGVKLGELRQKNFVEVDRRSKAARKKRKQLYREIEYTMSAYGSFEEIANFLRHLEGGKAHFRIGEAQLMGARDSLTWDGLSLSISLSVLGHKE
ncbi:hypothetical protein MLD52_02650 [Puniceicoccaceae bacterium K14]|nr:hypothetical protein [Puniceicoccaceae bacterium K14]